MATTGGPHRLQTLHARPCSLRAVVPDGEWRPRSGTLILTPLNGALKPPCRSSAEPLRLPELGVEKPNPTCCWEVSGGELQSLEPSWTFDKLDLNGEYEFKVSALNKYGEGPLRGLESSTNACFPAGPRRSSPRPGWKRRTSCSGGISPRTICPPVRYRLTPDQWERGVPPVLFQHHDAANMVSMPDGTKSSRCG